LRRGHRGFGRDHQDLLLSRRVADEPHRCNYTDVAGTRWGRDAARGVVGPGGTGGTVRGAATAALPE